ncbi:MAG: glycosyltransferase family 2 protein [Pseudomonadota bacterium]
MTSALTALIVTHHGGPRLARCVTSLRAQVPPPQEILVVVSNPAPVPLPPGLRALHDGRSRHYGAAVNLGARAAQGEHLLVLNDDTVLRPGVLAALLAAATPDALLQPRILLADPAGHLDNAGHGLCPDGHNLARGRGRRDDPGWSAPGHLGAVSGAAFLAPRGAFLTRGGFDEDLGPFGEDLDLSLRWVRAGGALRYVPEAAIEHELGASYGRATRRKVYLVERNRLRAAARSLPVLALALSPATTPARWALMALAAQAGRSADLPAGSALFAIAGAAAGIASLPEALGKRRHDAPAWALGEAAMLAHLLRSRAHPADLFQAFRLSQPHGSE